jgi:hypothetical protein
MVESRQEEVLSIIAVFTVFASIFVASRVYSRYLGSNFGWDDYLIIGAMVLLFGQTIAIWKCKCWSSNWVRKADGHVRHTAEWYWISCLGLTQEAYTRTNQNESMEFRRPNVLSSVLKQPPKHYLNVSLTSE